MATDAPLLETGKSDLELARASLQDIDKYVRLFSDSNGTDKKEFIQRLILGYVDLEINERVEVTTKILAIRYFFKVVDEGFLMRVQGKSKEELQKSLEEEYPELADLNGLVDLVEHFVKLKNDADGMEVLEVAGVTLKGILSKFIERFLEVVNGLDEKDRARCKDICAEDLPSGAAKKIFGVGEEKNTGFPYHAARILRLVNKFGVYWVLLPICEIVLSFVLDTKTSMDSWLLADGLLWWGAIIGVFLLKWLLDDFLDEVLRSQLGAPKVERAVWDKARASIAILVVVLFYLTGAAVAIFHVPHLIDMFFESGTPFSFGINASFMALRFLGTLAFGYLLLYPWKDIICASCGKKGQVEDNTKDPTGDIEKGAKASVELKEGSGAAVEQKKEEVNKDADAPLPSANDEKQVENQEVPPAVKSPVEKADSAVRPTFSGILVESLAKEVPLAVRPPVEEADSAVSSQSVAAKTRILKDNDPTKNSSSTQVSGEEARTN